MLDGSRIIFVGKIEREYIYIYIYDDSFNWSYGIFLFVYHGFNWISVWMGILRIIWRHFGRTETVLRWLLKEKDVSLGAAAASRGCVGMVGQVNRSGDE